MRINFSHNRNALSLIPRPDNQVRVLDVEREESVGDSDVLVMATDGLWDVVSNAAVAEVVKAGLKLYEDADETRRRYRHISIAQVRLFCNRTVFVTIHSRDSSRHFVILSSLSGDSDTSGVLS